MTVRTRAGITDDGHHYLRAVAHCDSCFVEGEPAVGAPHEIKLLSGQAAVNADLDASGRCSRCREAVSHA